MYGKNMINGLMMEIMECLNMKSILKCLLMSRLIILSICDLIVVLWISWYDSGIEYEALLDVEYDILLKMGLPTIPLSETIFNVVIVTIAVNMIVLTIDLIRLCKRRFLKHDLTMALVYVFFLICCMLLGNLYLSTRIHAGIINEYNLLFKLPIMLFGKDSFMSIVDVNRLYFSLCAIHLCMCMFYLYTCIRSLRDTLICGVKDK